MHSTAKRMLHLYFGIFGMCHCAPDKRSVRRTPSLPLQRMYGLSPRVAMDLTLESKTKSPLSLQQFSTSGQLEQLLLAIIYCSLTDLKPPLQIEPERIEALAVKLLNGSSVDITIRATTPRDAHFEIALNLVQEQEPSVKESLEISVTVTQPKKDRSTLTIQSCGADPDAARHVGLEDTAELRPLIIAMAAKWLQLQERGSTSVTLISEISGKPWPGLISMSFNPSAVGIVLKNNYNELRINFDGENCTITILGPVGLAALFKRARSVVKVTLKQQVVFPEINNEQFTYLLALMLSQGTKLEGKIPHLNSITNLQHLKSLIQPDGSFRLSLQMSSPMNLVELLSDEQMQSMAASVTPAAIRIKENIKEEDHDEAASSPSIQDAEDKNSEQQFKELSVAVKALLEPKPEIDPNSPDRRRMRDRFGAQAAIKRRTKSCPPPVSRTVSGKAGPSTPRFSVTEGLEGIFDTHNITKESLLTGTSTVPGFGAGAGSTQHPIEPESTSRANSNDSYLSSRQPTQPESEGDIGIHPESEQSESEDDTLTNPHQLLETSQLDFPPTGANDLDLTPKRSTKNSVFEEPVSAVPSYNIGSPPLDGDMGRMPSPAGSDYDYVPALPSQKGGQTEGLFFSGMQFMQHPHDPPLFGKDELTTDCLNPLLLTSSLAPETELMKFCLILCSVLLFLSLLCICNQQLRISAKEAELLEKEMIIQSKEIVEIARELVPLIQAHLQLLQPSLALENSL